MADPTPINLGQVGGPSQAPLSPEAAQALSAQTPVNLGQVGGPNQGPYSPAAANALSAGLPDAPASMQPAQPAAPAMPQAGSAAPSPDALLAEANRLKTDAKQIGEAERAGVDDNLEAQRKAAEAQAKAEIDEAHAQAPIMEERATQAQHLANAQLDIQKRWQEQQQRLAAQDAEVNQAYEKFAKDSHPKDLWTAAGVNPLIGRIAVMLGGIGSALAGGPNDQLEYVKALAAHRAQQIEQEGKALGMRASRLAQLHAQTSQNFHDSSAANDKLKAMLMDSAATQIDQVANNFRDPKAKAKAQGFIANLKQDAAKLKMDSYQKEHQAAFQAFTSKINVYDHMLNAASKTAQDKQIAREQQKGRIATDQAIQLIEEFKRTSPLNIARRNQLLAQIAPLMAKADQPSSNRILTKEGRSAENAKLGGIEIPLLGRIGTDPDAAIKALRDQQTEREGLP